MRGAGCCVVILPPYRSWGRPCAASARGRRATLGGRHRQSAGGPQAAWWCVRSVSGLTRNTQLSCEPPVRRSRGGASGRGLRRNNVNVDTTSNQLKCATRGGMASFKAKFPALQELFAKNHRGAQGPFGPPPPAGRGLKRNQRKKRERKKRTRNERQNFA